MKIAQVIGSLLTPLGGAEQYVLELARAQAAAGHDVTVVTGWVSPAVASSLAADGIALTRVRMRRPYPPDRRGSRPAALIFHALDLVDSVRVPRALRDAVQGFDVVHAHRVAGLGAGFLRTVADPVVTVHDYSLVDTASSLLRNGVVASRPPLLQRMRTRVMSRAVASARMVFPNDTLRATHKAWGLEVPVDSVVIPHGWRLGPAQERRGRVSAAAAPIVFLFLGKYLPSKGVDLLLDAWDDGVAGAELWLAGAGTLAPEVEAAAAAGRIRDLGWLDASARDAALAAADVLVLPSTGPEIFLLAAAEGALAGLPVISTAQASPPAVRDGVTGVLVDATAPAVRAAMVQLLDAGVRSRLSAGAVAFADELDFDAHVERVLAAYPRVPEGVR